MVKTPKTMHKLMPIVLLLVLTVTPLAASAQPNISLEVNYPEIPTPIGPVDLNCLEVGLCNFSIALVILMVYSIALWMAGLLAFFMLLYTGFTYIAGGASPGARRKAKRMFTNVLWGLAILLLSNALLTTINDNILQLEDPGLLGIKPVSTPVYESPRLQWEPVNLGSEGVACFEDCMNNCQDDETECQLQCEDQCSSSGGGDIETPDSCEETVESGTDESYNPEGSTKAEIQDDVFIQLEQGFEQGGLDADLVEEYTNRFFTTIIPQESAWVPHAENPEGANCMPVGLYQLEDNRFQKQQCKNEFHRWHHWKCETPHAIERFFEIRGTVIDGQTCSGFEYWAPAKRAGWWTCNT